MRWAKTTEKMNKVQLYFQQLKEKLAYFFSMSDVESRSARKRMWKVASGVFIVFFLRIALKRQCIDLAIARSIHQGLGLRFSCNDLTLG